MTTTDLTACLKSKTSGLAIFDPYFPTAADLTNLLKYMDRVTDLTFYDFMFLRKAANAMHHCADQGYF